MKIKKYPGILLVLFLSPLVAAAASSFTVLNLVDYAGMIYRASSTLEAESYAETGSYGMHNLFDSDPATGWSEGVEGSGLGEYLWLQIDAASDTIAVVNGFARSERLYYANNRVREIAVSLWGGYQPAGMVSEIGPAYIIRDLGMTQRIELADTAERREYQLKLDPARARQQLQQELPAVTTYAGKVGMPPVEETALLMRLEIVSVYAGEVWDDTCLSELRVYPRDTHETPPPALDSED